MHDIQFVGTVVKKKRVKMNVRKKGYLYESVLRNLLNEYFDLEEFITYLPSYTDGKSSLELNLVEKLQHTWQRRGTKS